MGTILLILLGAGAGYVIADRSGGRVDMLPAVVLGAVGAVAGGLLVGLVFAAFGLILRLVVGLVCAVVLIGLFGMATRGR